MWSLLGYLGSAFSLSKIVVIVLHLISSYLVWRKTSLPFIHVSSSGEYLRGFISLCISLTELSIFSHMILLKQFPLVLDPKIKKRKATQFTSFDILKFLGIILKIPTGLAFREVGPCSWVFRNLFLPFIMKFYFKA